jgi:hypothetical protein
LPSKDDGASEGPAEVGDERFADGVIDSGLRGEGSGGGDGLSDLMMMMMMMVVGGGGSGGGSGGGLIGDGSSSGLIGCGVCSRHSAESRGRGEKRKVQERTRKIPKNKTREGKRSEGAKEKRTTLLNSRITMSNDPI